MSFAYTLDVMSRTPAKEKPVYGRAIAARRGYLSKSLMDIERDSNGVLYTKLLSRVENGEKHVRTLEIDELRVLLVQLDWTLEDFIRETGVTLRLNRASSVSSHENDRVIPTGYTMIPVMEAQAGSPETYPVPDGVKRRPGTRAFIVRGDSMVPTFVDGDALLIDPNMTNLQEGKIFVLEVIGNGHCVKRVRKIGGEWVLDSDNPAHGLYRPDEVNVIGQVYIRLPAAETVR